jgi:mannose-6-phosphate isomerase
MIKLIDACDRLSVQVHPVKTEMWYIVDCKKEASLVYGLKDSFDETAFRSALANKTTESLLHYVPVHKGDVFFIPQGMVHAIGDGILIAEIQENSNVTYRVYDYDRLQNGKPRDLHVDEAMKTVKDFTDGQVDALRFALGRGDDHTLANCPSFRVDRYEVDGSLSLRADEEFLSVICLEGEATVGGEPMKKGDSYFLPAGLGKTDIVGTCEILVTSYPSQTNT